MPEPGPTADAPATFYLLLTFWGDRFRDYTCRYALSSLLAHGNLPALRDRRARFLIATTAEDWSALQHEPVFQKVRDLIPVEFVNREEAPGDFHKYVFMSRGHALLAERCFRDRAFAININPDSIYPENSIAEALRLADAGQDVVLCAAVRFDMEGVQRELASVGIPAPGQPLAIPVRDAVKIGLRNLHPETCAAVWTARNFGRLHPSHQRTHFLTCCLWRVPEADGALIVTHNWSPFLVNYGALPEHDVSALDGRALDGTYIFDNFPEHTDAIHVVRDSDSLFLLGLTPHDEMVPPEDVKWWKNVQPLGEWVRGYILNRTVFDSGVDEYRQRLYQLPVRWHAQDLNEGWGAVEAFAHRILVSYAKEDLDRTHSNPTANPAFWIAVALLRSRIVSGHGHLWTLLKPVGWAAHRLSEALRHVIIGTPPRTTPLHRLHADCAAILAAVEPILARGNPRAVVIGLSHSILEELITSRIDCGALSHEGRVPPVRQRSLHLCVIEATASQTSGVRLAYERAVPLVRNGGLILLIVRNERFEIYDEERLARLIAALPKAETREITFVGGISHLAVNRRAHTPSSLGRFARMLRALALLPVVWQGNRSAMRASPTEARRNWTTMLVAYRVHRQLGRRDAHVAAGPQQAARPLTTHG
ncbi:MAG: hypothetical protein ACM30I_05215 [Gemmatimonas sp.]